MNRPVSAMASHLLRSTASNVAGQVTVLLVWFALTPLVVHQLGAADYGLWVLVASLVAYGNLLDLGIGAAVTRYVAELRARGRPDEASRLLATALRIYGAIGLLVAIASGPLALVLPDLFGLSVEQRDDARWVVFLTGLALAVQLPATCAYAVLRGLQRFSLINVISVSSTLLQAAATIAVLELGGGIVGLAAIAAPLTLMTQVLMVIVIRRVAPDLSYGFRGAERRLVSTVFSYSASLAVINGAGVLKTKTDEIVIAGALPIAAVAPYSIARRVSELPSLLTYQFVRILFPLASELRGAGRADRVRDLYVSGTRVTLALFIPVGIGLVVLVEPFITAWVGPRFARDADLAVVLIGAGMIDMLMWPAVFLLQGGEGHRLLALFSGTSALLNLGLSIALVGGLGVTGVAVGTLAATALEAAVVIPFGMRRYAVKSSVMLRDALAPGLVPAIPAVLVLVALRDVLDPSSLVAIILVGLVGGVVYVGGYLGFAASRFERLALSRMAVGLLGRR